MLRLLCIFFSLPFVFLIFLIPSANSQLPPIETNSTAPKRALLFVAELCRHGDRSPLAEFPSDALPLSKWPEGKGELTAIGMRAHYELGARLRARYVDTGFLPPSFSIRDVYVRSTDVDRTLMSAISQMTGLYPPGTSANEDVRVRFGKDPLHENEGGLPHLFQPVPVHTEPKHTDQLLLVGNACLRHEWLMRRKYNSWEFQSVIDDNADFLEEVRKICGKQTMDIFDLEALSDTWSVFQAHSVPLPTMATPDIVEKARNMSNWLLTVGNQGLEVNRLRAGLLLYHIKERMQAAAMNVMGELSPMDKNMVHKFVLFSAHDTTVAATLAAMHVFDGKYPPYNSTIIWEFFKDMDSAYSVRVEYNGNPLLLPGCSNEYCPIEEYIDSIEKVMVPGDGARVIECLTGWKRYAAMAYYKVSGKRRDPLEDFVFPGTGGSPSSPIGAIAGVAVVLILTIAGVISAARVRARYNGYSRTRVDPKPDHARQALRENFEERILM